jgi:hypothetical protein
VASAAWVALLALASVAAAPASAAPGADPREPQRLRPAAAPAAESPERLRPTPAPSPPPERVPDAPRPVEGAFSDEGEARDQRDTTGPRPATARRRPARRFGRAGGGELAGLLGFDYVHDRDEGQAVHRIRLAAELYGGYFVARGFALGMYLVVNTTHTDFGDADLNTWSLSAGAMVAPGLALPLSAAWVLYGDLLVGGFYRRVEGLSRASYAALGAELGLKARLAPGAWLRVGLRPLGYLGKDENPNLGVKSDLRQFALLLRIGLSAYL